MYWTLQRPWQGRWVAANTTAPFTIETAGIKDILNVETVTPISTFIQFCVFEMHTRTLNNTRDIVLIGLEWKPRFFTIADTSLTARAQTIVSKLNRILKVPRLPVEPNCARTY
jgi:hypothetical protein